MITDELKFMTFSFFWYFQLKKMQDRVSKSKEEVQKTREKYEAALQEITRENPKYIEEMRNVFDKCQDMEAKRLQYFKDIMFSIQKCINISEKPEWVVFFIIIAANVAKSYLWCYVQGHLMVSWEGNGRNISSLIQLEAATKGAVGGLSLEEFLKCVVLWLKLIFLSLAGCRRSMMNSITQ